MAPFFYWFQSPCPMNAEILLRKLRYGGVIVSAAELNDFEIALAEHDMRIWYDEDGNGYVWMPPEVKGEL